MACGHASARSGRGTTGRTVPLRPRDIRKRMTLQSRWSGRARALPLMFALALGASVAGCERQPDPVPERGAHADDVTNTAARLSTQNGFIGHNGLTTNGLISNGLTTNGFIGHNGFI